MAAAQPRSVMNSRRFMFVRDPEQALHRCQSSALPHVDKAPGTYIRYTDASVPRACVSTPNTKAAFRIFGQIRVDGRNPKGRSTEVCAAQHGLLSDAGT